MRATLAKNEVINNGIYEKDGSRWWDEDTPFYTLRCAVNPVRVNYSRKRLQAEFPGFVGKKALEVGCGGGLLTEEIARMGFTTVGIDPAESTLRTAREHAKAEGLKIQYDRGEGGSLPYPDNSFDVVFCCDVLEHIEDINKTISEISRVLKPEGVFIFDTFNRTLISKIVVIKLWQDWKRWAFMEPNAHVWRMFIKPAEMKATLERNGLQVRNFCGTKPNISIPALLSNLRKRAKGEWSFKDFGDSFHLVEDKDMNIMYMGVAVKSFT